MSWAWADRSSIPERNQASAMRFSIGLIIQKGFAPFRRHQDVLQGTNPLRGIYRSMEAYDIIKLDGEYVVLALGQPQLTFRTLEQAEAAVRHVQTLDELPCWQVPWPESLAAL